MKPKCDGRTDDMFPRPGERAKAWQERSATLIRTLCHNGCPVYLACREMGEREPHGIWGGLTEHDRGYTLSGLKIRKRK